MYVPGSYRQLAGRFAKLAVLSPKLVGPSARGVPEPVLQVGVIGVVCLQV